MKAKKGNLAIETPVKGTGVIKRRKGSKKLYVDFYYFGQRITRSTELDDTPANERKVRAFLNRIAERIEDGTFKFAEAFPGASEHEKAHFTQLEGREYRPEPHQVLFGEYVKEWMETIFPSFSSPTKRNDYREAIETKILPHFKNRLLLPDHQHHGFQVRGVPALHAGREQRKTPLDGKEDEHSDAVQGDLERCLRPLSVGAEMPL